MDSISVFPILPTNLCPLTESDHEFLHQAWEGMLEYYQIIGIHEPWIGYLFRKDDKWVGTGGFKGKPSNGQVEIAYAVSPEMEGLGIGTKICAHLTTIAQTNGVQLRITARTLPEKNASTSVLTKNGYELAGPIQDPDDGEVWEWEFRK